MKMLAVCPRPAHMSVDFRGRRCRPVAPASGAVGRVTCCGTSARPGPHVLCGASRPSRPWPGPAVLQLAQSVHLFSEKPK